MTDFQLLIFVLCLIYLGDCCMWVPRGSVVFRRWGNGPFTIRYPSRLFGNDRGGFVFLNPLPPLGVAFICTNWPISVTPEAMFSYTAACTDPAGRPRQPELFVAFQNVAGIWHVNGTVFVNAQKFIQFKDETAAAHCANFLKSLWQTPVEERDARIQSALSQAASREAIEEQFAAYRSETAGLRWWCVAVFALLFVVLPASAWFWQIKAHWPVYVAALLVCIIWTSGSFFSAHKRLLPGAMASRWKSTATMICMPTGAIRACDALSRHLLAMSHPLAVASVLCDDALFRVFARQTLLDLANPSGPAGPWDDPRKQETEESFRASLRATLESVVAARGIDVGRLVAEPPRSEADCVSFCPRCDTQYRVREGTCEDCGGIRLQRFPDAA